MIKKNYTKSIQFFLALTFYLFGISCQGPLEGEKIEFITPNVYKDLPPEATRIIMKTKNTDWGFIDVQYNDTIAELSTGRISKINHGEVIDTTFSYKNKKGMAMITGSFFTIKCQRPENKNAPKVITVDIAENNSNEKRVLLVQLLDLDAGSFFRIEQSGSAAKAAAMPLTYITAN